MKKYILFLTSSGLIACHPMTKEIEVCVENHSGETMENVIVHTSDNTSELHLGEILNLNNKKGHLKMKTTHNDGSYVLEYTLNKINKKISKGYYSNGLPLETTITFKINK